MTLKPSSRWSTPGWSQVFLLGSVALRLSLSLVLTMLVGRLLTPQQFGTFALVSTVFALAHEFTDMGTGNVAVRLAVRQPGGERAVLARLLGLRLLLCLVAAAAAALFSLSQAEPLARGLVLATAAVLAVSYVSACSMVFQLRQAQLGPAVLTVVVQGGTLAGAAALSVAGVPGAWWPGLIVLREAATVAGTAWLGGRLLGHLPRPRLDWDKLRVFYGAAAVVAAATLAYHAQIHGGVFALQALRDLDEVGRFAAAQRPLLPLAFVSWMLMIPLVPVLAWLAPRDRAAFRRQSRAVLDLAVGLGAVIAVCAVRLAEPGLLVLFGGRFLDGPLEAVAPLRWMALSTGCSFPVAVVATMLLAEQAERRLLALSLAGFALYVVAILLLVPAHGATGAAAASALAVGAMVLVGLLLLRHVSGTRLGVRTLAALLPAAVLWPLLGVAPGPALVQLATGGLAALLAVLAVWHLPGLPDARAEQAALASNLQGAAGG